MIRGMCKNFIIKKKSQKTNFDSTQSIPVRFSYTMYTVL